MNSPSCIATVVISTRNRCDDLRRALSSCLRQSANVEVIVIDDGSTDGTPEMVRREFPTTRLVAHTGSAGYIVRRNEGARLATTEILFSIDDDAEFTSPDTIEQTRRDFSSPQIAAVAIPHVEPNLSPVVRDLASDNQRVWVTSTFKGTSYAVRRERFLQLGGFREHLIHQGEESDFCIRLLDAGYYVRLGRADPITHYESPKRDRSRMDYYGPRNAILFVWQNVPILFFVPILASTVFRTALLSLRPGRFITRVRGIAAGLAGFFRYTRSSVKLETYRRFRASRGGRRLPTSGIKTE